MCINISVFGDTIYVANGVYEEQVVLIPGLSLIGSGTDSCIVDSRSFPLTNNRTITMKDSCLVTGFYIRTSNNLSYGQGIRAEGQTGLITLNKFSNSSIGVIIWSSNIEAYKNHYFNLTAGIWLTNSNSLVRKNIITLNQEGFVGIHIEGVSDNYTPVIDSNYVETQAFTGIYKFLGSRPTIKNNVIKFSQSGAEAIYLMNSDVSYVYNNLIINTTGQGGIYDNSLTHTLIHNNYIIGNPGSFGIRAGPNDVLKNNIVTDSNNGINTWDNQNLIVKFNNAWNNLINYSGFQLDTTNLSVDPMVMNNDSTQGDLNFRLQMYSPLIDAGDPNILDKDGTRSDIGLYGGPYGESYLYIDLPPQPPVNLTAKVDSLIKLNWNKNTEADFSYFNVYRDTTFNFTVDSTKLIASVTDTFYYQTFPSNIETLYYKLTAVDNQGNESSPSEQVYVKLVTVKNEWVPVNNYILYQNYPNPFNPSTKIGYKLKERGYVKLYVYDIKGELISVLVNETQEVGYYEVEFNAEVKGQMSNVKGQLASGVYIYQIFVKGENNIPVFSDIKKMVYVK
jgi:hypothetical protein